MLVNAAVSRSSTATAFASCSVTNAVLLSALTAKYSGSRSREGTPPGNNRTPLATSVAACASNAVKSAVVTAGLANPPATSTILTPPIVRSSTTFPAVSPSFATSSLLPSGVNAMWSGFGPVTALPSSAPVAASKNTTYPTSVFGTEITPAASTAGPPPVAFLTVTDETSLLVNPGTPSVAGVITDTKAGAAGLDRSIT